MRTMLKMQLPVEAGNEAVRSGRIAEVIRATVERLQPEAAYFGTEDGKRSAYVVFDLQDPSQLPVIAEPLFQELNGSVSFAPVMNLEELQKGTEQAAQG